MIEQLLTDKAPVPSGPYSQGMRAGNFIFTAGQLPIDPKTGKLAGDSIEVQTYQVLENLKAILATCGAGMEDVVKATVHLRERELFARFNAVYERYFPDPKPVRTTVGSQLAEGVLVEIDLIAYKE